MPILERSKITVWQRHLFKNFFCYRSFRYVSTLRKKVFSAATVKHFFLMAQIIQILLFSRMPVSERSRITVWQRHLFKNFSSYGSLRLISNLRKNVFSYQWSTFFFRADTTQIPLFWRMPVWERPEIAVWERHFFKNFFCYGSFRYVSTLRRKVFSAAPVKHFFLMAEITQILLFSGMLV